MAFVRVEQRNAHLADTVRLEFVNGRDGQVAKATLTAISNVRWGSGDAREEEATAILWTLWGKQAEHVAQYLGKGSHVNVVGRVRNNNYEKDGQTVYGLAFTCDEIDFLDSKAQAAERRSRHEFVDQMNAADGTAQRQGTSAPSSTSRR
jgi:single-strand DNA-binding protein